MIFYRDKVFFCLLVVFIYREGGFYCLGDFWSFLIYHGARICQMVGIMGVSYLPLVVTYQSYGYFGTVLFTV